MLPNITIIIPVYNVEKYLTDCLNSVLMQSYENFEVLLIDDGSADNSGQLCDEYAIKDKRIKVFHKRNGGLAEARNFGIERAKADYLYFLDSDDCISPDSLDFLLNKILNHNCEIVSASQISFIDGEHPDVSNDKPIYQAVITPEEAVQRCLTLNNMTTSPCGILFKKNLFDNLLFPIGRKYEDMAIIPMIYGKASRIFITNECKYYYRYRENSITNYSSINSDKTIALIADELLAAEELLEYTDKYYPKIKFAAEDFLVNVSMDVIRRAYANNVSAENNICCKAWRYIKENRRKVFWHNDSNPHTRIKAAVSYLGMPATAKLLNVYKHMKICNFI